VYDNKPNKNIFAILINMKKQYIIFGSLAILLVASLLFMNRMSVSSVAEVPPIADPIDVVLDFYTTWKTASADGADPFTGGTLDLPVVSATLKTALVSAKATTPAIDPVTCQETPAERVRGRLITNMGTTSTILIESRNGRETLPTMALVNLRAEAGEWKIESIECTLGDVAPEVEFTFDREGFLLKSVPPPYESGKWHLVYEQDGQLGYVAPLLFTAESACVTEEGSVPCAPDTFTETTKVVVKGNMTELGAEVVRIEF
jgi:hypothetical protein